MVIGWDILMLYLVYIVISYYRKGKLRWYMKVSELKQNIEDLMLRYGDLDIIFKDEYSNNRYEIKDVMLSFSKGEDKYIITNHYYE